MAKLTKAVFYMEDPMKGRFVGYANMDFYHRGFAPYFDKDTCFRIMEDYLTSYGKYVEEVGVEMGYNANDDCFYHIDENGDINDTWIGKCVEVNGTMEKLYAFGEGWMWQAEEEE